MSSQLFFSFCDGDLPTGWGLTFYNLTGSDSGKLLTFNQIPEHFWELPVMAEEKIIDINLNII